MQIKLQNVRLAFPDLFEAKAFAAGDKPSFGASLLFAKNHPQVKELEAALVTTAEAKWGVKGPANLKALKASDKTALHDGDSKAQYAGFEGNFFVSASNPVRPLCLDNDKTPLVASDGRLYSGCYVNAIVELWGQDNAYGKRLNATLMGVQFLKDGEAFSGGGSASADDFDTVEAPSADEFV